MCVCVCTLVVIRVAEMLLLLPFDVLSSRGERVSFAFACQHWACETMKPSVGNSSSSRMPGGIEQRKMFSFSLSRCVVGACVCAVKCGKVWPN